MLPGQAQILVFGELRTGWTNSCWEGQRDRKDSGTDVCCISSAEPLQPRALCAAEFLQCLCTNHFFLFHAQILPSQLQRSRHPLPWRSRVSGRGALSKPVLLLNGNISQPKTCSLRRFLAGSSHVLCTGNTALGISVQVRDTHGIFVGLFLTNPLMLEGSLQYMRWMHFLQ